MDNESSVQTTATFFDPVDLQMDFPLMERNLVNRWYEQGIVEKYLHKNDASEKYFSFQDGPITANNPMGVHHAWGRTYKDLWQRYKNMQGYKERFQNGFDCQGLWVEVEVEKELGLHNKKDIENLVPGDKQASIAKFIELCRARVMKFSGIQTEQTKRLGNFMDWENSYFTMSSENNYMIWHFLKKCFDRGLIYKGHDSVPWCPRCGTAISQHEMLTEDYKDAVHESVFFALPVTNEDYSLLVWTTTPWTVPANVAVAVHPDWTYAIWKNEETNQSFVILDKGDWEGEANPSERVFTFVKGNMTKVREIQGSELLGKKYSGPYDGLDAVVAAREAKPDTFHMVIAAKDLVTPHEGTGLVHIAPGAGTEDFSLGKANNLPVIAPIDDEANYFEGFGELSLKNAKKHPELIIDHLKTTNFFVASHMFKHRYPACWRCKTELVWRVVDEWYIGMDIGTPTLRSEMIEVAKKISWMPEFGLKRELDWLENMHDWLISKKRYWGLALPIWVCSDCGEFEVLGGEKELKERAVEGLDAFEGKTPHKPYIDGIKISCSKCGGVSHRIPDVGNPWLDAGIVPFSTVSENNDGKPLYLSNREEWQKWFPVDFITESFPGQFKNWFYSMIAMSTVLENKQPFDRVLGFGTLLAEDGRAMHKSWGNSIEFSEGADKIGADVMRWMYAATNPADNMLFGYKKGDEARRQVLIKLWNSYNFFVVNANASGFSPEKTVASTDTLDVWIKTRMQELIVSVTDALDAFDATSATAAIETFIDDLSNWYIRRSRERITPEFLSTLHGVLVDLCRLMAPIMPFVTETMYTNLTKETSVHLASWPEKTTEIDSRLTEQMAYVREVTEIAHSKRKDEKIPVRQPLRLLTVISEREKPSEELLLILADELNVKNIDWQKGEKLETQFDTTITPELLAEAQARELVRMIQGARKEIGTALTDEIVVSLPSWPKEHEEFIMKKTLIQSLTVGDFSVRKVS